MLGPQNNGAIHGAIPGGLAGVSLLEVACGKKPVPVGGL